MFENPRRGRQARNFTTNVPKILDLKSSSEQIFSRKLSLGAPDPLLYCKVKKGIPFRQSLPTQPTIESTLPPRVRQHICHFGNIFPCRMLCVRTLLSRGW